MREKPSDIAIKEQRIEAIVSKLKVIELEAVEHLERMVAMLASKSPIHNPGLRLVK